MANGLPTENMQAHAVLLPRLTACRIPVPSPEIDHALAAGPNGYSFANFVCAGETFLQGVADGIKCRVTGTEYFSHHIWSYVMVRMTFRPSSKSRIRAT